MCLAIPGQVVTCEEEQALVDFQGNRLVVGTVLTPEVRQGDWVLVHAGFAIVTIDEQHARETWDYLRASFADAMDDAGDSASTEGTSEWPRASDDCAPS